MLARAPGWCLGSLDSAPYRHAPPLAPWLALVPGTLIGTTLSIATTRLSDAPAASRVVASSRGRE
eukprot:5078801-Pyramimonas_sp.AAC.1